MWLMMCILHISHIATKAMKFTPTPQVPALQYIGSVEKEGAADMAGLKSGDFLLEVRITIMASHTSYRI